MINSVIWRSFNFPVVKKALLYIIKCNGQNCYNISCLHSFSKFLIVVINYWQQMVNNEGCHYSYIWRHVTALYLSIAVITLHTCLYTMHMSHSGSLCDAENSCKNKNYKKISKSLFERRRGVGGYPINFARKGVNILDNSLRHN